MSVSGRVPDLDDFALCCCGHIRVDHHLETGCKPGDKCGCRPCTGRHDCKCTGFVSYAAVKQRRAAGLESALRHVRPATK